MPASTSVTGTPWISGGFTSGESFKQPASATALSSETARLRDSEENKAAVLIMYRTPSAGVGSPESDFDSNTGTSRSIASLQQREIERGIDN